MADDWREFDAGSPFPLKPPSRLATAAAAQPSSGGWEEFDAASPFPLGQARPTAPILPPAQPSLLSRVASGIGSGFTALAGAQKRVVDVAANYYAGNPDALNPHVEPVPTGDLMKNALLPAEDAKDSYLQSGLRAPVGFLTDLATDPLTYETGGLAKAVPLLAKAAGIGFTGMMGHGAYEQGKAAVERYQHEGFTPQVLEEGLGAALLGTGAALGAKHLASGEHAPSTLRDHVADEARKAEAEKGSAAEKQGVVDIKAKPAATVAPAVVDPDVQAELESIGKEYGRPADDPLMAKVQESRAAERAAAATGATQPAPQPVGDETPAVLPPAETAAAPLPPEPQTIVPETPPTPASVPPPAGDEAAAALPAGPEQVAAVEKRVADRRDGRTPREKERADIESYMAEQGAADTENAAKLATQYGLPPDHPAVRALVDSKKSPTVDNLTGLRTLRAYKDAYLSLPEDHAVTFFDLEHFKDINDTYGHDVGDAALKHFANIVSEEAGPENAHRRTGGVAGDEFFATHGPTDNIDERVQNRLASEPLSVYVDGEEKLVFLRAHAGKGTTLGEADVAANASRAVEGRQDRRVDVRRQGDAPGEAPGAGGQSERSGLGRGEGPVAGSAGPEAPPQLAPPAPGDPTPGETPPPTKHSVAPQEQTAPAITREHVQKAFPTGKLTPTDDGHLVTLPGNREVRVSHVGEIEYNPESFKAGYGRAKTGEEKVVGSWTKLDRGGIIQLAKEGATDATLLHESFHAAMDLALSEKQKRAVLKAYGNEEAAADAYGKWKPENPHGAFQQIHAFFKRIYRSFVPSGESVFGDVRSGKAFEQGGESGPVRQAFATAASAVGDRVENFKKWFGGSKVVDEQGAPQRVYHGTPQSGFSTFDVRKQGTRLDAGDYGKGFYFTDRVDAASDYAMSHGSAPGREGAGVLPVYLDMKKPFVIDTTSGRSMDAYQAEAKKLGFTLEPGGIVRQPAKFSNALKKAGYDGVIWKNRYDAGDRSLASFPDEYVVFEPTQIKSAIGNRGSFDPTNPDIRYATGKGEETFTPERPKSAKAARAIADRTGDPGDIAHAVEREANWAAKSKTFAQQQRHVGIATELLRKYGDREVTVDELRALPGVSEAEAADFLAHMRTRMVPGWVAAFSDPMLGEQKRAMAVPRLDHPSEIERYYRFKVSEDAPGSAPKYATAPVEPPDVSGFKAKPIPEKPKAVEREKETVLGKEGRAAAIRAANADIGEAAEGKPPDTAINFERVGTDQGVKDMQGRIVGELEEHLGKAKGYRSWTEAREKALASGITEADFVRMMRDKEGVSDHVIEAGRMMREESARVAKDAIDAAAELKRGGGDAEAVLTAERAADAAVAKHAAVTWGTVRAGAEAGRALAIHAKLSEGLTPSERFFKKALREVPLMTEAQRNALAKAVVRGDHAEIAKVARGAFKPSVMDKFLEYWKAGLVSGPATIGGNFISNALFEGWRTVERGVAGAADAAYSAATGAERTRYAGEAFKALTSLQTSVPRAMSILWDVLKDPRTDFDLGSEARVEHSVPKIGGKLGEVVRSPFRVLKAFDEAAKHVARQNELFAQAYRMAKLEGGKNVDARMAQIVKNAGEYGDAAMARKAGAKLSAEQRAALADPRSAHLAKAMDHAALEATFQDQAGKITQGILLMRGTNPLWQMILPFVKTPSRLLSAGLDRSPVGFAKVWKGVHEGTLKDRGQIMDALVKPMVGTALGIGFVAAAKNGLLTGSGPADPRERRLKEATGWQPFSFKVGGQYVSYKRLEPLSTTLGLAADFVEASDEERGKIAEKIQQSVVDNITSKSYLQGVANLGELIADPKRYGATFIKNLESSLVPNIVGKAAVAIDPTVRDTSGPIGSLTARIPGLSKTLDAKRAATGDEIERPGSALERFASPFTRSPEKDAPLERELLEIGYAPSSPTKSIALPGTAGKVKVELTPEEMKVMQDYDRQASERLRKVLRAPGYRAMPPDERAKYVRRIYDQAGSAAKQKVTTSAAFRARARERYMQSKVTS